MHQFTPKAIFVEAAAIVVCGFLVGLIYDSWKAVVIAQGLLVACEAAGYAIEGWLRRRREMRGCDRGFHPPGG
jgi:hypothetical protein